MSESHMSKEINVDMLTKKLSGLSYEQSSHSQSLPSASMTGNGVIDCIAVEVCNHLVARTKEKQTIKQKSV
jgi:hypothetical protein